MKTYKNLTSFSGTQKYDVVIPVAKKDYVKLFYVVRGFSNLQPKPEGIYIIAQDSNCPCISGTEFDDVIHYYTDEDILPLEYRERLQYRPHWIFQMFLVLLQNVTKNDLYMGCMADNIFINPLSLFHEDGKPCLFISPQHEHHHPPYWSFNSTVYEMPKFDHGNPNINHTFIIEFLMYNKNICKDLLKGHLTIETFLEEMVGVITTGVYPAEQELFGNLVSHFYPRSYHLVYNTKTIMVGKNEDWTDTCIKEKLNSLINEDAIAISCHTWRQDTTL